MVAATWPGPQPDQGPVRGGGREPSPQPRDQWQQQVQQQLQQQGLVPGAASLWYDQLSFIYYLWKGVTYFLNMKKLWITEKCKPKRFLKKQY